MESRFPGRRESNLPINSMANVYFHYLISSACHIVCVTYMFASATIITLLVGRSPEYIPNPGLQSVHIECVTYGSDVLVNIETIHIPLLYNVTQQITILFLEIADFNIG